MNYPEELVMEPTYGGEYVEDLRLCVWCREYADIYWKKADNKGNQALFSATPFDEVTLADGSTLIRHDPQTGTGLEWLLLDPVNELVIEEKIQSFIYNRGELE